MSARLLWQGVIRRGCVARVVASEDPDDGHEVVTCERMTRDALDGECWVEDSGWDRSILAGAVIDLAAKVAK